VIVRRVRSLTDRAAVDKLWAGGGCRVRGPCTQDVVVGV